MSGDSLQSNVIKSYFIKIREFVTNNRNIISQAMNKHKIYLKKFANFQTIYFFVSKKDNPDIFKIGKTSNIINRLKNYNVGRYPIIDLKYLAIVSNANLIESCVKLKLKSKQVEKNKELYTKLN